MLKDVTLGRYYSRESLIHSLDPRVKIRFIIIYILLLVLDRNLPLFALLTAIFVFTVMASRVPLKYILKGSKSIIAVIIIFSGINIFTTPGTALIDMGFIRITAEGCEKFGFVLWRMLLLVFMSSMLMYTTTPTRLTDGLEKCFHLSGNVAMGITIALRFVSVIFEELDRIIKAQEARGADFHSGGISKRIHNMKNVIVPLFQNSINRASNLGEAMDARCYTGGKGRTKLKPLHYGVEDYICYVIMLAVTAVGVWMIIRF